MRTFLVFLLFIGAYSFGGTLPSKFDLRSVQGKSFVSRVKNQSGGTCWTHGTMAAIESNLMMSGEWKENEGSEEADLAEYHLDWWNGFNQHENADLSSQGQGLTVHEGGDYRVAAAYLSRGDGVVRDSDGQSYNSPPKKTNSTFHQYYVREIHWFTNDKNLSGIDKIKQSLIDYGAMGTALTWSDSLYSTSKNSFYQSDTSTSDPNHAVTIVGWDDAKVTQASKPGAWLIKNSWGSSWGSGGYFWISYYDKIAGKHDQMGAVSFREVERMNYANIYYHDYHGWRDTKTDVSEAFNSFEAKGIAGANEVLKSVSFYTAKENVEYDVRVYGTFANGELSDQLSVKEGVEDDVGFHTVNLNWPVTLQKGQKFFIYVRLSEGGHPYDKTSNVPVLLGASARVTVESVAKAGQSYFRKDGKWLDLTTTNATANFCLKGLTIQD